MTPGKSDLNWRFFINCIINLCSIYSSRKKSIIVFGVSRKSPISIGRICHRNRIRPKVAEISHDCAVTFADPSHLRRHKEVSLSKSLGHRGGGGACELKCPRFSEITLLGNYYFPRGFTL